MVKDITRRVLTGELDRLSGRAPLTPLHQFITGYDRWSETAHRPSTARAEKLASRKLLALIPSDTISHPQAFRSPGRGQAPRKPTMGAGPP